MAGVKNSKLKLLYLAEIFEKKTDENHYISATQLCDELAKLGIPAERKFQLAEIRLLSDAVQAANFISQKKTNELVKKIESFASDEQAKILHSQVYVDNRPKCKN